MKHNYDKETDTLTTTFRDTEVEMSEDHADGSIIIDKDADGNVVSIEHLDASTLFAADFLETHLADIVD